MLQRRDTRAAVLDAQMQNVTGAMPKSLREKAKSDMQDIWMAETKKEANAAFDLFIETYGKYEKAVAKLVKDRDELLAFYDFPAEHWETHPDHKPDRERFCHGSK